MTCSQNVKPAKSGTRCSQNETKKSYLLWTIDTGLTKKDTHHKTKMIFQGSAKQPEKVSQYNLNDF